MAAKIAVLQKNKPPKRLCHLFTRYGSSPHPKLSTSIRSRSTSKVVNASMTASNQRVVSPYPAVYKDVAALDQRPVVDRRGGCRQRRPDHRVEPISPIVGVMRRLEDVYLAMPAVEARNTQSHLGIADGPVAQLLAKNFV